LWVRERRSVNIYEEQKLQPSEMTACNSATRKNAATSAAHQRRRFLNTRGNRFCMEQTASAVLSCESHITRESIRTGTVTMQASPACRRNRLGPSCHSILSELHLTRLCRTEPVAPALPCADLVGAASRRRVLRLCGWRPIIPSQ
jgi:hypothetical protein